MTLDIAKLKAAAEKALLESRDEWGYDTDAFHDEATPETILELLAERDADRARIAETDEALCNLLPGVEYMDPPDGGSPSLITQVQRMVEDYRNRIAELEARKVTLKLPRYSFFDFREGSPYQSGAYCNLEALINECKQAGINLETGGE